MKYCHSYNIDAMRCDCGSTTVEHQEVVKKVEDKTKEGFFNQMKNFEAKMENEVPEEEGIKEGERRKEKVRVVDQIIYDRSEIHGKHENREHQRDGHPRDDPASVEGSPEYLGGEFRNGGGDPSRPADPSQPRHRPHQPVEHDASENPADGSGENPDESSGGNPDEGSGENPN